MNKIYLLRVMRLIILFFITGFLHLSAASYSQTVTLQGHNMSLEKIFESVRLQTGYEISGFGDVLKDTKPVNVDVRQMAIDDFLKVILRDQPLTAEMEGKTIILSRRKGTNFVQNKSGSVTGTTMQQPIIVSGIIIDSIGHPIPRATIRVLKTELGVAADEKGQFWFPNLPEDAVLHISSIGYREMDISLSDILSDNPANIRNVRVKKSADFVELTIILFASENALADVEITPINTGYLKILPQQSTGAVSQINTRQFESQINTNLLMGLQNKLSGLLINNDIKFNGNNLFQVRGISTFSAGASPLIVMDGYPTNLSINDINPNEIKAVTLLKDAAAAAIYGAKASNGVIVVERKEAISGKPQLSFRSTFGFQPSENYSKYRWAPDDTYINYLRGLYLDGDRVTSSTLGTMYSISPGLEYIYQKAAGFITQDQMVERFNDLLSYNNIKDYDRLFLRTAFSQAYNLDISGGNDAAKYYVTGNYSRNNAN